MTRIDQRGAPIVLTEADRARLADLFRHQEDVVAAYLFGSQATGRAGPLSDVDLAVWLDPGIGRRARSARVLELMAEAAGALRSDEVQVAALNDAPPLLVHRVLRGGRRLADRDPGQRLRLETRAVLDYLDMAPMRREFERGLAHRLEEGRVGRP